MDPDAFTPVPHFTNQGIFKAKPLDELRLIKGIEFPSVKTIVASSFGMNQQFLSTRAAGGSSMMNVKIAAGSMYTVLFGLLHLPDPSGKTLSEVDAACALPPASASSSAAVLCPAVVALQAQPSPELTAASAPQANPAPELTTAPLAPASASSPAPLAFLAGSAAGASERPYVLRRRITTKRTDGVARASAVLQGPQHEAIFILAWKDFRPLLDWPSRSALARACKHVARSDVEFLRKLRWSFQVEAVLVRRVPVLQRALLDLPAALSVVSVALSCWRDLVGHMAFPHSDDAISLIVDVMLTVGIAASPRVVDGAKQAIRARHEAAVFDNLVCRCLEAIGHKPE
jgi:hypothetical protein